MTQYARPVAILTSGGWTGTVEDAADTGGVSDTTFLASPYAPVASQIVRVQLGEIDPSTGGTVRVRFAKHAVGGDQMQLTVRLVDESTATVVATRVVATDVQASWTEVPIVLTAAEIADISDWGALVVEAYGEVYVPPASLATHPRLILVGEGATVGQTVSEIRGRVLDATGAYLSDFIAWCASAESVFLTTQESCNTRAVSSGWATLARQCYNAALLAILDPDTLIHPTTGARLLPAGHDRVYYATLAKYAALSLSTFLYNPATGIAQTDGEGNSYQDWEATTSGGGLKTLPLALAYDWTMAVAPEVWSAADRLVLAEAAVRASYAVRNQIRPVTTSGIGSFTGVNGDYAIHSRTGQWGAYGILLGEALWPEKDSIAGSCAVGWTTTKLYADELDICRQRFRTIHAAIAAQCDYYCETGLWQEGEYYNLQAITGFWAHVDAYRTVVQADAWASTSFFANYAEGYRRFLMRPQTFTADPYNNAQHVWKYGSGSDAIASDREFLISAGANPGVAKWMQENYLGYPAAYASVSALDRQAYWWFTRWIHGVDHVTAEAPSYPLSGEIGNGLYAWRSSRSITDATQTLINIWGWENQTRGGHADEIAAQVSLFRGGVLLPSGGGADKSGPSSTYYDVPVQSPNNPIASSAVRAWPASNEVDTITNNMLKGSNSFRSATPNPNPSLYGTGTQPNCIARLWGSQNNATFDALKLDLTYTWATTTASAAARTYVWLKPVNSGYDYLLVLDEITLAGTSATTHRAVQNWQLGVTDNTDLVTGRVAPLNLSGTATRVAHPDSFQCQTGQTVAVSGGDDDWSHGEWTSTDAKVWRWRNTLDGSTGAAILTVVEPTDATIHVLGGSHYWHQRDMDSTRRRIVAGVTDINADYGAAISDAAANWYGRWRIEVRSPTGTTARRFLSVIQFTHLGTALTSAYAVTRLTSGGGELVGVHIADPARPRVAMFCVGTVSGAVSYDVGTATTCHHVVTGLTPGATYTVTKVSTTVTLTPTGASTVDSGGCLEFTL